LIRIGSTSMKSLPIFRLPLVIGRLHRAVHANLSLDDSRVPEIVPFLKSEQRVRETTPKGAEASSDAAQFLNCLHPDVVRIAVACVKAEKSICEGRLN